MQRTGKALNRLPEYREMLGVKMLRPREVPRFTPLVVEVQYIVPVNEPELKTQE